MKKILIILGITITLLQAIHAKSNMSQAVYNKLNKSQELILKKDYKASLFLLKTILASKANDYERSYALQYIANIYIEKNDYKKATSSYEKIVKLEAFDKKNIDKIKYSLSRIYLSLEDYEKCIKVSKQLLLNSKIKKKDIYENLIFAYYYTNKFKQSILYTKEVFKEITKPKESLYQILYSSYIEEKEYKNAIKTLKVMLKRWHKNETYWLQLISLYQEQRAYKKSLATFELAYKKDGLNQAKHSLYFANILLQNNLYNKAALVLENSLKNGFIKNDKKIFETLVSSYLNARETNKAVKLLEKSSYAKTPKFTLLLANIQYNKQRYKETIKILKDYKIKRNTRKDGEKYILLALSYNELDNKKECINNLKKAHINKYEKKRAYNISKSLQVKI